MIGCPQTQTGTSPNVTPAWAADISLARELGGVRARPINCLHQGLLNLYKKDMNNKTGYCCMEALGGVSPLSLTRESHNTLAIVS